MFIYSVLVTRVFVYGVSVTRVFIFSVLVIRVFITIYLWCPSNKSVYLASLIFHVLLSLPRLI